MANNTDGIAVDSEYEEWCQEKYGPVTDDEINAMASASGYIEENNRVFMVTPAN